MLADSWLYRSLLLEGPESIGIRANGERSGEGRVFEVKEFKSNSPVRIEEGICCWLEVPKDRERAAALDRVFNSLRASGAWGDKVCSKAHLVPNLQFPLRKYLHTEDSDVVSKL
jgi:hypothetical protein